MYNACSSQHACKADPVEVSYSHAPCCDYNLCLSHNNAYGNTDRHSYTIYIYSNRHMHSAHTNTHARICMHTHAHAHTHTHTHTHTNYINAYTQRHAQCTHACIYSNTYAHIATFCIIRLLVPFNVCNVFVQIPALTMNQPVQKSRQPIHNIL